MVAELVEERAEKGPVGDHLAALGRQHPDRDAWTDAAARRLVKSLELAAAERRATPLDANRDRRNTERATDAVRDLLGDRLDGAGTSGSERRRQTGDQRAQARPGAQRKARHPVARRGDAPEGWRQATIPGRRWDGRPGDGRHGG